MEKSFLDTIYVRSYHCNEINQRLDCRLFYHFAPRNKFLHRIVSTFIVSFSSVAIRVYSFDIEYQFVQTKFIKSSTRSYDFRTQATLCHLLVIDNKATVLPVKQLDSVMGAIIENVDNTISRIEIIAAYQLGQVKNTLMYVHGSTTNPKNICFVKYKHKFFGQR